MGEAIREELEKLAEANHVRVLYACESGSRAWGFASPDSDYDIRFIYVHEPGWYLSIQQGRDVIEQMGPDDLDFSGWDLRKALRLLRKSNPPMIEWLHSPIVYSEEPGLRDQLRRAADACYSPENCFRHYLSMARGNMREYLQGETVWLKKYFYVLRPILACVWIERGRGIPPVEFERLCEGVIDDASVKAAVDDLVARKKLALELDKGPRIEEISSFVEMELMRLEDLPRLVVPDPPVRELDELFLRVLGLNGVIVPPA
jgi:uncharacterized protein